MPPRENLAMPRNDPPPTELDLHIFHEPACPTPSDRGRLVCAQFGLSPGEEAVTVADGLRLRLRPGQIILLLGPSGSGKTSILKAIAERTGGRWVGRRRFPPGRAVVDGVAPRGSLRHALALLTSCGLAEPRLWLRCHADLSEGEQWRAGLARTIGAALWRRRPPPVLCDEFTARLHRRAARATAFNLRKLIRRTGLTLIAAAAQDDVVDDLQPNTIVRLGSGPPAVVERTPLDLPVSLRRAVSLERGSARDYHAFHAMHYRRRDGLGFVDRVFVLRESAGGELLGIVVYAHPPLELAVRNRSTLGRFVGRPERLNAELRILRRLVMHPDVRGCGLGHWLVRRTLPLVGVRFVECLAALGAVNPVFERAGLSRVGPSEMPRGQAALLERLHALKADPFSRDFARILSANPEARRLVEETIARWLKATQSAAPWRLQGRSAAALAGVFRQIVAAPPIYYLWDREGELPKTTQRDGER